MRLELPGRTTQALIVASVVLSLFVAVQLLYPAAPSVADTGSLPDDEASLPEFGSEAAVPRSTISRWHGSIARRRSVIAGIR